MKAAALTLAGIAIFSAKSLLAAELGAGKANAPRIAPASDEAELALSRFVIPSGFKVELFAAEPLLAHPVAFAVDERNRLYVAESFRVGEQVTDIRRHMNWLDEELASTNTAQWRAIIQKYLDPQFMTAETERVTRLEDTDGDGRADVSKVLADGFNDLQSGIAAGVLARQGDVWFTCIPDLWRLRDTDGDGLPETRQSLHHGYGVRFGFYGHDLHGLRIGPDGKLYFSIGDRGFNVVNQEGRRLAGPEMGAVFRCNLDGSDLEVFATGLRNPQELAFDPYGNLFTGDNNSDGGDQARLVYLVEGGDSGWRIGYQFLTTPVPRGPWNAERMWQPQNDEQPAFLVPPLANLSDGPSGLTYNPGLGLPPEYDRHFFLADFRGTPSSSLIHAFAMQPRGASFEIVRRRALMSQILVTDVDFGMDGALYVSDWVEGWGKTGKGRIYRLYHSEHRADPRVAQTKELMAQGFSRRTESELASLLSWPDQRVRQEAQFELASRGRNAARLLTELAREGPHRFARLHAIWGLGQIHAQLTKRRSTAARPVVAPLTGLLSDADEEVRAQAAKVLGEARHAPARGDLARLAADRTSPRVQFFAALALGKIGGRASAQPVLAMLRENADRDPYLRHAGVMSLHYLNDTRVLREAGQDPSPAVRMAALLALRRQGSPRLSQFLRDEDPRVALEAARAIYDLPVEAALPALASLIEQPIDSAPLLRRVVHANYRQASPESASALARLAATPSAAEAGRIEALQVLGAWANPSGRDRVTGLWRPLEKREGQVAAAALRPFLNELLAEVTPADVQAETARLAGQYELGEAADSLARLAQSERAGVRPRVEALRSLARLKSPLLAQILETAGKSADERVRREATALLAKLNPGTGLERLASALETGTTGEKQAAFESLGSLANPRADQVLIAWIDKLLAKAVEPSLHLDLLEAAGQRQSPEVQAKLGQVEAARPESEIGGFLECLTGGDASAGRKIFFERAEVSCARCHKVGGQGGEAGPELDDPKLNRNREYLLESIVAPNKSVAPGFENLTVKLKDGAIHSGIVKSETATDILILSPEDGPVKVTKDNIEVSRRGGSGMPEGLAFLISKRDLRDLIEFLATVK